MKRYEVELFATVVVEADSAEHAEQVALYEMTYGDVYVANVQEIEE